MPLPTITLRSLITAWVLAFVLAVVLAPAAQAADLAVMPVAVQMTALKSRSSVTVQNNGREPVVVQADVVGWQRQDGVDRHGPAQEMLVNPPVFTLPPGQSQIVRLGLRDGTPAQADERTYRLVLRELPAAAPNISAGVQVLMAIRLPIYVAPAAPRRGEQWTLARNAEGRLEATLTNTGNVHLRVAGLTLDAGGQVLARQEVGAVLLAGETRRWILDEAPGAAVAATAAASAAGETPLTLSVRGEQGAQHVALRVPPR